MIHCVPGHMDVSGWLPECHGSAEPMVELVYAAAVGC